MAFQLYLRRSPRALVLLGSELAIVVSQVTSGEDRSKPPTAAVEVQEAQAVSTDDLFKISRGRGIGGILGLTSIPLETEHRHELFLVVASGAVSLPPLLPNLGLAVNKLLSVEFHSLSSALWDDPASLPRNGSGADWAEGNSGYDSADLDERAMIGGARGQTLAQQQGLFTHPCEGMKRYIESGTFYYSANGRFDISTRLSEWDWDKIKRGKIEAGHAYDSFDDRFVWNANILRPLLDFRQELLADQRSQLDASGLLVLLIQGFCGSASLAGIGASSSPSSLSLISRLGWRRAGARFRTRGVDDDGNVANFVESETILSTDDVSMSFVQVRGSVPLFWEQQGLQALGGKLQITRPQAASQPAFDKHIMDLLDHYEAVHAVNLLGSRGEESTLSMAYDAHLNALAKTLEQTEKGTSPVSLTHYDFHAAVKVSGHDVVKQDFGRQIESLAKAQDRFGWTTIDRKSSDVVERQHGVFRTNCLDCLDRTNYVQDVISSLAIAAFLGNLPPGSARIPSAMLASAHRTIWADNGDNLSKIYAGTGALNTSVTRTGRRTFGSFLSDTTKSLGRVYTNAFLDTDKQKSIDLLLGLMAGQQEVRVYNPTAEALQAAMATRLTEYSTEKEVSIWAGTWNLNGRPPQEPLHTWLFPPDCPESDIYMIGLQEVVPLNAQQILQTDPSARLTCEVALNKAFDKHKSGEHPFIQLRSEQLVGTCLIVFVRADILPNLTRIEASSVKTGLRGMSGNKGGIGVRLQLFDTSFCFMSCHLAAGHTNVAERNADYHTIAKGLTFLRGKTIADHDVIIWAADFNYRIDLDNEHVRECVAEGDIQTLWEADQLRSVMLHKDAFGEYAEGRITFAPTYKYDRGTTEYDTSEKMRIPAWTDRILYRGKSVKKSQYNRIELLTSDHRPVYARFVVTVHAVDEGKRAALSGEITRQIRSRNASQTGLDRASGTGGSARDIARDLQGLDIGQNGTSSGGTGSPRSGGGGGMLNASRRAPPAIPGGRPKVVINNPQTITPSSTGSSASGGDGDFVMVPPTKRRVLPPPSRSASGLSTSSIGSATSTSANGSGPRAGAEAGAEKRDLLDSPVSAAARQAPILPRRVPPGPGPGQGSKASTSADVPPASAIPPAIPARPRTESSASTTSVGSPAKKAPIVPPKPKNLAGGA